MEVRRINNLKLLSRVLAQYAAELERVKPGSGWGGKGSIPLLEAHPDILIDGKGYWEAYVEAEQRLAELPPLQLRPDDFVSIAGRIFRIGHVDGKQRLITTERLDQTGSVISSCPCRADFPHGRSLEAIPAPDIDLSDWPRYPATMTDGLSRARWRSRQHALHLIRAGLDDDDD